MYEFSIRNNFLFYRSRNSHILHSSQTLSDFSFRSRRCRCSGTSDNDSLPLRSSHSSDMRSINSGKFARAKESHNCSSLMTPQHARVLSQFYFKFVALLWIEKMWMERQEAGRVTRSRIEFRCTTGAERNIFGFATRNSAEMDASHDTFHTFTSSFDWARTSTRKIVSSRWSHKATNAESQNLGQRS